MIRDLAMRRATLEDVDVLADIQLQARASAMPWLAVVHTPDEVLRYFEEQVLAESDVWLATRLGRLAGFSARRDTELDHLYVAPPFWRLGAAPRSSRSPCLRSRVLNCERSSAIQARGSFMSGMALLPPRLPAAL